MILPQSDDEYFNIRSGLASFDRKLRNKPCKIAFLGNSVTAQREGFRKYLSERIDQSFNKKNNFINAGIGGVGSLASAFLVDDFVLRYRPDICFVECTVADIGGATPDHYIASSIEGIIQKLISNGTLICFLNLYNSHTTEDRIQSVISLYEKIAEHYQVPSINVNRAISLMIKKGAHKSKDIVYDGIHTTTLGGQITSDLIFFAFEAMSMHETPKDLMNAFKSKFEKPFSYTQLILPSPTLLEFPNLYKEGRFRGIIKYLQIEENNTLRLLSSEGSVVGVFIVADEESGVVFLEANFRSFYVQTYDLWCDKERIQAIVLEEPCLKNTEFSISFSTRDEANRGPNGKKNDIKKIGKSLKIIGLMMVLEDEPKLKVRLW
jgi:hypothetical protein